MTTKSLQDWIEDREDPPATEVLQPGDIVVIRKPLSTASRSHKYRRLEGCRARVDSVGQSGRQVWYWLRILDAASPVDRGTLSLPANEVCLDGAETLASHARMLHSPRLDGEP
jgi:hypothetical protein